MGLDKVRVAGGSLIKPVQVEARKIIRQVGFLTRHQIKKIQTVKGDQIIAGDVWSLPDCVYPNASWIIRTPTQHEFIDNENLSAKSNGLLL